VNSLRRLLAVVAVSLAAGSALIAQGAQTPATSTAQTGPQRRVVSIPQDLIRIRPASPEGLLLAAQLRGVTEGAGTVRSIVSGFVKDLPFSARGVTEFTMTLGDGTHVRRTTTFRIYRDSEGRMRREDAQGAWISDPVTKMAYVIDHATRTARQLPLTLLSVGADANVGTPPPAGSSSGAPSAVVKGQGQTSGGSERLPRVSVGVMQEVIDGAVVNCSRTTRTIPIGTIGNDRVIEVVSERCLSRQLNVVLLSRVQDPLNGDTTFRLSQIQRQEPAATLFAVPAGYRLEVSK
jgi:hypothetical protein